MKKAIFIFSVFLLSTAVFADPPLPNNDNSGSSGGTPVGGGAPIAGGLGILLSLSAVYALKSLNQSTKEEAK
jgi:hypothetical protein